MKKIIFTILLYSNFSLAESYESYDEIVDRLTRQQNTYKSFSLQQVEADPDKIHMGMGLVHSFYSLRGLESSGSTYDQGGVGFSIGIDLFKSKWLAEGTFKNLGSKTFNYDNISLREFELRAIHRPWSYRRLQVKWGAGVGARYISVTGDTSSNEQTPTLLGLLGMDAYLGAGISIGPEFNLKKTFTGISSNNIAADIALRIDAHF